MNKLRDSKKDTITLNTPIKCSNVFNNYSNIEFSEIYAGYYYQPQNV